MRRVVLGAAAWVAGAAAATALTWAGVGVIGARVADTRPLPVGRTTLGPATPTTGPPPVRAAATPTTMTPGSGPTTTVSPPPRGALPSRPESNAGATVTTAPTTGPPSPPPTTPGPGTPTTQAPPTTTTAVTRTYGLIGGSAAVRFAPSGATLLWATPNEGFTVEVEPEGNGVTVTFERPDHRSRLEAWWDGGPRDRIREEPKGDD